MLLINDYLSFIILLFGLFCVTGNISVDVAFGIEWFFLKAGGEGSDTTH